MTAPVESGEISLGRSLSVGKRRALQALSTPEHLFTILAVDHISALSSVARPDDPASMTNDDLASIKVHLVSALAGETSGVLVDPVLGLAPIIQGDVLPGHVGLLVGLEDGDYASLDEAPRLFKGWDVAHAAVAGATAIKCSFLYDPFSPSDAVHQFVSDLAADCDHHGLPLFGEPLVPESSSADRRAVVVETARRIGSLGVDILKLEFPSAASESSAGGEWREACLELTEAIPVPWTLLSGGESFDTYASQLEVACKAGASGYVAGRTVWKESVARGADSDNAALEEARRRLRHLAEIVVAHGKPWSHWFESLPGGSGPGVGAGKGRIL
jgi:tagatose-1,6-bisphosphate aldolase